MPGKFEAPRNGGLSAPMTSLSGGRPGGRLPRSSPSGPASRSNLPSPTVPDVPDGAPGG